MAPELLLSHKTSLKTEIFSFGILVHEIIFGYLPLKFLNRL